LRQSQSGARLLDTLIANKANVVVLSDEEFAQDGQQAAHAYFRPANDTIYMRRSDLQADSTLSAVELAHEGVHLLDEIGNVDDTFVTSESQRIGAITDPVARDEATRQAVFELTMIKEARAVLYSGQIVHELGYTGLKADDPTMVAATGGNDQATYGAVWNALLASAYNPDHRTAAVKDFGSTG
jgi:hypothetical protein